MANFACPYCYELQDSPENLFEQVFCTQCGQLIPATFLSAVDREAPIYMATVGFSSHGKTTYMNGLTLMIENLGKIAAGTYHEYLDEETYETVRRFRQLAARRDAELQDGGDTISGGTQLIKRPRPLLINLYDFLERPVSPLVMYDLSGEVFSHKREEIEEYAGPLRWAHTIWFMLSVRELRANRNPSMHAISDLFSLYRRAMAGLGISTQGRNLLVVYTKADEIGDELPEVVRQHMQSDPYTGIVQQKHRELRDVPQLTAADLDPSQNGYHARMRQVSDALREYTMDEVEGGLTFVNMVRASNMNLLFTATSSLGHETSVGLPDRRYRIIDALMWSLQLNNPILSLPFALILDFRGGGKAVFANGLPAQLVAELKTHGTPSVYTLGVSVARGKGAMPAFNVDEDHHGYGFVGPILEQLPPEGLALLVTDKPIADLGDFDTPDWHARLGILWFQDEPPFKWPNSALFSQYKGQLPGVIRALFGNILPTKG